MLQLRDADSTLKIRLLCVPHPPTPIYPCVPLWGSMLQLRDTESMLKIRLLYGPLPPIATYPCEPHRGLWATLQH